ncbi:hypothetical protein ES708_30095 [subsurface metagenome]
MAKTFQYLPSQIKPSVDEILKNNNLSYSIILPRQKSVRIHLNLVEDFRNITFDPMKIKILRNNSQKTSIDNYIILIKNHKVNFSNKRSSFRYFSCNKYEESIEFSKQWIKGLPFAFYSKKNKLNDLTGKEWIKYTKSWFVCRPPPRKKNEILHPAKFPEPLVDDFIQFFTKKGELVVDPFLGTGSTMISSFEQGRSCIGFEINKKYFEISKKRIEDKIEDQRKLTSKTEQDYPKQKKLISKKMKRSSIISFNSKNFYQKHSDVVFPFEILKIFENSLDDKRDLIYLPIFWDAKKISKHWKKNISSKADFCITSPPYWNQLKRCNIRQKIRKEKGLDTKYSDLNDDIGNIDDYNDFLDAQKKVFKEIDKILKKNAYIVVITNNIYTNGQLYPLAFDTLRTLSEFWVPKDEKIWCQNDKALIPLGVNSAWVGNRHHQYCLIFRKELG